MSSKSRKEQRVTAGTRRVIKLGSSLAITLPSKFAEDNNIKEGDDLPYAADRILKFIPMPEK
jgi:antitoxin component of MazEF toxin-antitoxin module